MPSVASPVTRIRQFAQRSIGGYGLALTLSLGMGASLAASAATTSVKITDLLQFEPKHVVIQTGDSVEWQNESVLVHTVTADPGKAARAEDVALPKGAQAFDSGNLDHDAHFRHRFSKPGLYRYFCIPHEATGMVGEVEVR